MKKTILLYDIDGTLVTTHGGGRRAIEQTFKARYGRTGLLNFPFGGMTDRAIVSQGLNHTGVSLDGAALEREIDEVLAVYIEYLEREVRAQPCSILPGMLESLELALGCSQVAVGLGTGNIRAGAELKLRPLGIYEKFGFGGFGCDHIDRVELLRIGAERGRKQLSASPDECRVVVIGDTPKDIAAAKAIGAECIAVATGGIPLETLLRCEPTWAFPNLKAEGALRALLPDVA